MGELEFKDNLRCQRDDWQEIISALEASNLIESSAEIKAAYNKAVRVYSRIKETLES